jgi:hypothetical protein
MRRKLRAVSAKENAHSDQASHEALCGCSSHRMVELVALPLLSHYHLTTLPSPKRYKMRYEAKRWANSVEHPSTRCLACPPLQAHLSATIG